LPRLSRWQRPAGKFVPGRVLEREPTALLVLIAGFTALEALGEMHLERRLEIDREWIGLCTATVLAYATLCVVRQRKHSRL